MTTVRAAFYARVSSEQQAAAHTIESQISALSERAQIDGTPVPPERQFVDDGVSGATLVRPALDRLRDLAAVGAIDRIYVHSPDRLARGRRNISRPALDPTLLLAMLIGHWKWRGEGPLQFGNIVSGVYAPLLARTRNRNANDRPL